VTAGMGIYDTVSEDIASTISRTHGGEDAGLKRSLTRAPIELIRALVRNLAYTHILHRASMLHG